MNLQHLVHLAGRFVESCKPGAPAPADRAWALSLLTVGESELWLRMSNPDQRHSIAVARAVSAELADVPSWVMAAALLHDVGKVECGYRTPARVAATLVWAVTPSERASTWRTEGKLRRGLALYHLHPEIGAELCDEAGSDPLTSAWAREHHLSEAFWTVPRDLGRVLKDCDDD